jgi:hypothetical protein
MTALHRIRERWDAFTHETERAVAPHVDEDWAEALLLELRLQGVPGDVVGSVLAEVDAHVVDSGTTAQDAFGDPVAYARSLDLPTASEGPRDHLRSAVPVSVQVTGMLLTLWATTALAAGEPMTVTAGHLVVTAALAVQVVALAVWSDRVLRTVVERPVATWFAFMGLLALNVVALVLLRQLVLSAPAAAVATLGVLLLATGTGLAWHRDRTGADHDPVLSPLAGAGPTTTEPESSPAARRWGAVGVWIVPIWTAVLVAITWALTPGA